MSEREAELESKLEAANLRIRLLEDKVDALLRGLYASKSEKLDPNQLTLLEDAEAKKETAPADAGNGTGAAASKPANHREPRAPRIPDDLPVREEILDPDIVKANPTLWRLAGEEVSERLDYEPAKFWKHRLIRRKYVAKATSG